MGGIKMILYFDNYITNTPLIPNFYTELDKIRASCDSYSTRDKFEITLYTLASYAKYPWKKAIIVYSLEDASRKEEFEKRARDLFQEKKLILIYGRSDTQKKYQEKVKIINNIKDDWIFYAGNNDHPFLCPNFKVLNSCIKKAEKYSKKYQFVSILYSHFSEGYNMFKRGTAIHDLYYFKSKKIEEDQNCTVGIFPDGWNTAIQIVNKKLLNHWVFSKNLGDKIYRRIESMAPEVPTKNQIVVCPKEIICEHFDGYSHTKHSGFEIPSKTVPPLFIPVGFFEKKIKIRYGYNDYVKGEVNINPSIENYRFDDPKNGTDLKISLKDLPLFWRERIKKININSKADLTQIEKSYKRNIEKKRLPFMSKKDRGYLFHIIKYKTKRLIYDSRAMKPLYGLYRNNEKLREIHTKINKYLFS